MRQIATAVASARERTPLWPMLGSEMGQAPWRMSSCSRRGGRCDDRRHATPARSLVYQPVRVGIAALRLACAACTPTTVPVGARCQMHGTNTPAFPPRRLPTAEPFFHCEQCQKCQLRQAVFFARSLVSSAAWNGRALGRGIHCDALNLIAGVQNRGPRAGKSQDGPQKARRQRVKISHRAVDGGARAFSPFVSGSAARPSTAPPDGSLPHSSV